LPVCGFVRIFDSRLGRRRRGIGCRHELAELVHLYEKISGGGG